MSTKAETSQTASHIFDHKRANEKITMKSPNPGSMALPSRVGLHRLET